MRDLQYMDLSYKCLNLIFLRMNFIYNCVKFVLFIIVIRCVRIDSKQFLTLHIL